MGKRKADHDPSRPKGKITAYAYFIRHKHEVKDADLSNLPFAEFSKKCSDTWKSMGDSGREPFLQQARDDKGRFEREISVWKANGGAQKAKALKKSQKDHNEPKRPQTAFFLFSTEHRETIKKNNPEFKVTDVARELGRMWREVSEDTKEHFAKMAAERKVKYKSDMEEYSKKKKELDQIAAEEQRKKQKEQAALQRQQNRQLQQQQRQQQQQVQAQAAAAARQQQQQQHQQQSIQQQQQQQTIQQHHPQMQPHQLQQQHHIQLQPQQIQNAQVQYVQTSTPVTHQIFQQNSQPPHQPAARPTATIYQAAPGQQFYHYQ